MVRNARSFNFGRIESNPDLARALDEMYTDLSLEVSFKISKNVTAATSPPASDPINKNFQIGDMWIRQDTNSVWVMTSRTTNEAVTWTAV